MLVESLNSRQRLRRLSLGFRLLIGIFLSGILMANAEPFVSGLHRDHNLNRHEIGLILMEELSCIACHQVEGWSGMEAKRGPDLAEVGSRLRPGYLRQFLMSPSDAQPGTTMPDILHRFPQEEKAGIAVALTHYLMSLRSSAEPLPIVDGPSNDQGKSLYESIGCVACHGTVSGSQEGQLGLQHVASKYQEDGLVNFLRDPLSIRPMGRMPDMRLTTQEARSIGRYLLLDTPSRETDFEIDPALVSEGSRYFQRLNCVACHAIGEDRPPAAMPITLKTVDKGCLAATDGFKGPRYELSEDQQLALRLVIESESEEGIRVNPLHQDLVRFNCLSCHERDGLGGVDESLESYFQTEEPELGNEGRMPPRLTGVGARLKTRAIEKLLFDGEVYRPYLSTRMPQFGQANLGSLPSLFAAADLPEPFDFRELDRQERRPYRDAGHLMIGDKGYGCIACHQVKGQEGPGFQGLDLMLSYERLRPGWFARYMRDPNRWLPGVVMPSYWSNGEAARKDILEGDVDKQIQALWYYLSLGTSAPMPSGIRRDGHRLVVDNQVRVYRGRSQVAGYRGIAVGFPNGTNYAFDAQNGALAAVWKGDYISVGWSGQGSGQFNPLGRSIPLPRDVAFQTKRQAGEPWPLRPRTTKEQPVNPEPMYPRNRGYQFQGYSLGEAGIPTLRYAISQVLIEDSIHSEGDGTNLVLARKLSFDADEAVDLDFRVLAGKNLEVDSKGASQSGLRLRYDDCETRVRPLAGEEGAEELILRLSIQKGRSAFHIRYEM